MKNIKTFLLFVLITTSVHASASKYAIIRVTWSGGYQLIYVDKPQNIKKWAYDSNNDTYYRCKNIFGMSYPVRLRKREVASPYVYIRPCIGWGLKLVPDENPKAIKKWQPDNKTGEYFRGKDAWGFNRSVAILDKTKE